MLQVENLSFRYRRRGDNVLNNFSLSIEPGKIYGLLGKNGVGKSTLLYLMSGLLTPLQGRVTYHGTDVRRRLPQTMQDIFLVPEEFELPPISLIDYIELNAPFYPRFSKEDMVRNLNYFELSVNIDRLDALSMGQKKKVFMSFALATNTPLLLMDEPTNGLDISGKSQFRKFLASGMSDEKAIVISTHQIKDIEHILDHVLLINTRQVLLNASVAEICRKLLFTESDNHELIDKALYSQPSIQGNQLLLHNTHGEDTTLNLELLFGAVSSHPEKFSALFNTPKKENV